MNLTIKMNLTIEVCVSLAPVGIDEKNLTKISSQIAYDCSRQCKSDALTILDGNESICGVAPHLTLYQLSLSVCDLEEVCTLLHSAAALHEEEYGIVVAPILTIQGNPDEGSIEIKYEKTNALKSLQERIVNYLNMRHIRGDRLREKEPDGRLMSSLLCNENVKKYGFSEGITDFSPHCTLLWLPANVMKCSDGNGNGNVNCVGDNGNNYDTDDDDIDKANILESILQKASSTLPSNHEYDRIGLYVLGSRGTCCQLLYETPLGNQHQHQHQHQRQYSHGIDQGKEMKKESARDEEF